MLSTRLAWASAILAPRVLCPPWGLPALTAPDEPPIFSRSRRDNLESSWAGLAGGGPSFSHSWIAAGREVARNSDTLPPICLNPNKYPGPTARQQERALEEAEGTHTCSVQSGGVGNGD